jgi:SIR2-like domain
MLPVSASLLSDPDRARVQLVDCLKKGQLFLLLGAGVSGGFGLPSWPLLVQRCMRKSAPAKHGNLIVAKNAPQDELTRLMDSCRGAFANGKAFNEFIRDRLYATNEDPPPPDRPDDQKKPPKEPDQESLSRWYGVDVSRRLIHAIGSLIIGSKRGRITDILTVNYDDIIEGYLRWHGYDTQTVCEWPCLLQKADARIFHLHGYLPRSGPVSDEEVICSAKSYERKLAAGINNPWSRLARHYFDTKISLTVGASVRENTFGVINNEAFANPGSGNGCIGFQTLGPSSTDEDIQYLNERKIAAIKFNDYEEMPEFLKSIAHAAME